jgi:HEAT repeat protein
LDTLAEIGSSGRAAIPALADLLAHSEPRIRIKAAYAMMRIDPSNRAGLAVLTRGLNADYWEDRMAAADDLGKVGAGTRAAVPALISLLNDEEKDEASRTSAARALGMIGSEARTTDALKAVLANQSGPVRIGAARALAAIDPGNQAAVSTLIEALRIQEWGLRFSAARALGDIGVEGRAAIPALIVALKDKTPFVRNGESSEYPETGAVAEALGKMGREANVALPALLDATRDQNWYVRVSAAHALGLIDPGNKVAAVIFTKEMQGPNVDARFEAAKMVVELGIENRNVIPILTEALEKGDRVTRREARETLRKWKQHH